MISTTQQHLPESDEKQLCVSCIAPNEPSAHFCTTCGAPLSSYASTGPFEHLFAEGAVYRQAVERPRSLIVVLGVWLIFGVMALAGLFLFAMDRDAGFVAAIGGVALPAISLVMIWKTTRNYLAGKVLERKANEAGIA